MGYFEFANYDSVCMAPGAMHMDPYSSRFMRSGPLYNQYEYIKAPTTHNGNKG